MDKKIKSVIKRIAKCDVTEGIDKLGDVIADIFFETGGSALFIANEFNTVTLLLPDDISNKKKQDYFLLLAELVAALESLERNRLIYVQNDIVQEDYLFFQGKDCFDHEQLPNTFKIGRGLILHCREDAKIVLKKDDKEYMRSFAINPQIGTSLVYYLCSSIIPTKSLCQFVERGFKTREERITQLSMRYSLISMFIALFVAALSPFLSVVISNRWGITTIKQTQMDSLLKIAKPVFLINKNDSSIKTVHHNNLIKKQKGKRNGKQEIQSF